MRAVQKFRTCFLFIVICLLTAQVFSNSYNRYSPLRGNGISFTENKGQIIDNENNLRPDVLFVGDGGGAKVYLRKAIVSYVFTNIGEVMKESKQPAGNFPELSEIEPESNNVIFTTHRVDMEFVGGNELANLVKEDQEKGVVNFYYPHCRITEAYEYNRVKYENMYQNIDVEYYGTKERGLKYDIIVKPHGDIRQIKLRYKGAEQISLENNQLSITTSLGLLGEYMPKIYQVIDGKEIDVKGKYVLKQNKESGTTEYDISFQIPHYNPDYSLIIDPWLTYYGGSQFESVGTIATDAEGNVIFMGQTNSVSLPVSTGAFQMNISSDYLDLYFVKMDDQCNRIFGTYFGGIRDEYPGGISADKNNNIFITGYTTSTNFPILDMGGGAYYQSTKQGTEDAFICKFTPSGSLLWSTYYGGSLLDRSKDIAVDANGNVVITGYTTSNNFPTQVPYQPAHAGGFWDAYIVKFDNNGVLLNGTYLGGESVESIAGIAIDKNNNIIVTGNTLSNSFPITPGAIQSVKNADTDIFISKYNANISLLWSTYYGGNNADYGDAIITDKNNAIIIAGGAQSNDFPVSSSAFQTYHNGPTLYQDAFLLKMDNNGNRLWATLIGGGRADWVSGIGIDSDEKIIIGGDSYSTDFPVTSCAQKTYFTGDTYYSNIRDQFVASFDSSGNRLCATFLHAGESAALIGNTLAVYGNNIYIIANTQNAAGDYYPSTANAFQSVFAGASDAVVIQMCSSSCGINESELSIAADQEKLCVNQSVNFSSEYLFCDDPPIYEWSFEGGSPATSNLQNPSEIFYNTAGTYDVKLVITTLCGADSVMETNFITVYEPMQLNVFPNATICQGDTISLNAIATKGDGNYLYTWQPGNLTGTKIIVSPEATTTYMATVSTSFLCDGNNVDSLMITVYSSPTASFSYSPGEPYLTDNIFFNDQSIDSIISWEWDLGNNNSSPHILSDFSYSYQDTGTYQVRLIVTNTSGCVDTTIKNVYVRSSYLFYAPNTFTPDGDHINDEFRVYSSIISQSKIVIYDRWGSKIYESKDIDQGWNGKLNDQPAQEGIYVYSITIVDHERKEYTYNGHVSLIR